MKRNEKLLEIIGTIDERHLPDPQEVFGADENDGGQEAEMQLSSAYKRRWLPVKAFALALSLTAAAAAVVIALKHYSPFPEEPVEPTEPVRTSETSSDAEESASADNTSVTEPAGADSENVLNQLEVIGYYIDDKGNYRFDPDNWQRLSDFDLFRKYFFGEWVKSDKGLFINKYPFYVMDDSEKSFNASEIMWRFGEFYKVSENVLAYSLTADAESFLFWLDISEPGIMYQESFNGDYLFGYGIEGYKMGVFTKTDTPPNEPENNFLSEFRLLEISRDYGIDFEMLTEIRYQTDFEYEDKEITVSVSRDNWYQSYPIYLVSRSADRFEFKTQLGSAYFEPLADMERLDAEYTVEKTGEKWTRTVRVTLSDGNIVTISGNGTDIAPVFKNELPELELLDCYYDEEGHIRANTENWKALDDYDIFRKYFFGAWEGEFAAEYGNISRDILKIDDSEQSYIMTNSQVWFSGRFYRTKSNVLVFMNGGSGGPSLFWLNTDEPEVLYSTRGGIGEHNRIYSDEGEKPEIFKAVKTGALPNEPENGFLSVYRIRDMAREYGIDLKLLTDIEYPGAEYVSHNAFANYYPVYLISEAPDKLTLKTVISDGIENTRNRFEAEYTLEKIGGEWIRTVNLNSETGRNAYFTDTAEGAVPSLYHRLTWETKTENLPKLTVMPYCTYSISGAPLSAVYNTDANPWREEEISTLPVFRNKCYGIEENQGGCVEKAELERMAKTAAAILGLTINGEDTVIYLNYTSPVKAAEYTEAMGKYPLMLTAYCDGGRYGTELVRICVISDGSINIRFGNADTIDAAADEGKNPEGYKLPYMFSWSDSDEATERNISQSTAAVEHIMSEFEDLFQFKNPQVNTSIIHSYAGETFALSAQDAGDGFTEKLLNYNFSSAGIYANSYDKSELHSISLKDVLSARGEYVGDYPVISAEKAKEILLSGKYSAQYLPGEYAGKRLEYKNIPIEEAANEVIDESLIRNVSLVYEGMFYDDQAYFQPYYRFCVESEPYYDTDKGEEVINQAYYYVPAVSGEYISGTEN